MLLKVLYGNIFACRISTSSCWSNFISVAILCVLLLVQSFYGKKGVNLKLIATKAVLTFSNTKKHAL